MAALLLTSYASTAESLPVVCWASADAQHVGRVERLHHHDAEGSTVSGGHGGLGCLGCRPPELQPPCYEARKALQPAQQQPPLDLSCPVIFKHLGFKSFLLGICKLFLSNNTFLLEVEESGQLICNARVRSNGLGLASFLFE